VPSNPEDVRQTWLTVVVCLGGALGSVIGCGPLGDEAERGRSDLRVDVAGGAASVEARDATVKEVLEEIARQSGLVIVPYAPLDERVTLKFEHLPLSEALRRILRDRSFALQQNEGGRRGKLWVFSNEPDRSERPARQGAGESLATASRALTDHDKETRLDAISVLAGVGDQDAATALVTAALSDVAPEVREEAVYVLGEIGGETSIPFLSHALADPNADVREAAVEALGEIGGEKATRLLRQTVANGHRSIRDTAAGVLSDLSDQE
jgi:hypothetical protein